MKLKLLALAICMLISVTSVTHAQELREYIGHDQRSEVILDIKELSDGGAVMVGYSTLLDGSGNFDHQQNDLLAMRVDNTGQIMWDIRIASVIPAGQPNASDFYDDKLHKVIVDANGDFVAVGVLQAYPWYNNSTTPGFAAIFKFNPTTGAYTYKTAVNITGAGEEPEYEKGSIFQDVVQLDNGDYVAVGANDARPGYSNSLITCFDGALNINWSREFPINSTDAFMSVAQENNRIFAGGYYIGNTQHDLHMMEIDATGNTVAWHKTYDYSLPSGSNCQYMHGLHIRNGELLALTTVANNYVPGSEFKAGVMRVNMTNGSSTSLYMFNDNGYNLCNTVAVDYTSNTEAYYITNPSNVFQWAPVPHVPSNPTFTVADALLGIVDPTSGAVSNTRVLLHTGEQTLSCLNIGSTDVYYAGISRNDPVQPSPNAHDVYYVRAAGGDLPDEVGDCDIEEGNLDDEQINVNDGSLSIQPGTVVTSPPVVLNDHDDELTVVMICEEEDPEPCDIEDITWCSSLANPYTYAFNTVTNPAGANVRWDFGDGSPTVNSTAGTTVYHTYAGSGSWTVCVEQLDASGQPCDELCIELCVADNGSGMKPGKSQQSSLLDLGDKTTGLAVGDLYPNPTDGTLNIPVTTQTGEDVSIRIIRMDGVVVYDAKETLQEGKQTLKVTLGNLTPGNYMCEIRDNKTRNTRMFTKQ